MKKTRTRQRTEIISETWFCLFEHESMKDASRSNEIWERIHSHFARRTKEFVIRASTKITRYTDTFYEGKYS